MWCNYAKRQNNSQQNLIESVKKVYILEVNKFKINHYQIKKSISLESKQKEEKILSIEPPNRLKKRQKWIKKCTPPAETSARRRWDSRKNRHRRRRPIWQLQTVAVAPPATPSPPPPPTAKSTLESCNVVATPPPRKKLKCKTFRDHSPKFTVWEKNVKKQENIFWNTPNPPARVRPTHFSENSKLSVSAKQKKARRKAKG